MQQHASYLEVILLLTKDELKGLYDNVVSSAESVYLLGISSSSQKKARKSELDVKFRVTLGIVDKAIGVLSIGFKPKSIESFRIRGILEPNWMNYLWSVHLINMTYVKGLFYDR